MKNLPTTSEIKKLHEKYAPNPALLTLVYMHCQIVAEIAATAAANTNQVVDLELLQAAALLHDIGCYAFLDPADYSKRAYPDLYPQHTILGAKIVSDEGLPTEIANIIECHGLLGLSKEEIIEKNMHLPARSYEPQTVEGRLLCYADRFHSKQPAFSSYPYFYTILQTHYPKQAEKFQSWSEEFGLPDLKKLSAKYGQPIR